MYRPKGNKGRCDELFSKIIRLRVICERCGSQSNLQCAHIISRRYSATRCDPLNAWCLCSRCHLRLTAWPREHSHFITETIGSEAYDKLQQKAETVTKVRWDNELIELKAMYKALTSDHF
jgi:5-methylcytosine-specific restriction endonuclease McrA